MSKEEKKKEAEWIGRGEINSIYIDAISTIYRKDAIKIEFGQVISSGEEKSRIKVVSSFIATPHDFKYIILDTFKKQLKTYEEEHGIIKVEK